MNRTWAILAAALAGCVQTSEVPLGDNVILVQATGISGGWIADLIVAEQIPDRLLTQAAYATVARGYTHFRLDVPTTAIGGAHEIIQTNTVVRVTMYDEGDPGAIGAIDAREIVSAQR